jgi:hypothetical protein
MMRCDFRLKKERERSPLSLEDENTQHSSPGWQGKLSALNFLHLQVGFLLLHLKTFSKLFELLYRFTDDVHELQVAVPREKARVLI